MTWLIFWSSVALALTALAWVSVEVVALEKREAHAQQEARRQESIRRALWRMDSRMTPILAIEAARPLSDYKQLEGDDTRWLLQAMGDTQATLGVPIGSNRSYANRYFNFEQEPEVDIIDQTQLTMLINSAVVPSAKRQQEAGDVRDDVKGDVRGDQGKGIEQPQKSIANAYAYGELDQARESSDSATSESSDFEARRRVAELASQSPQRNVNEKLQDSQPDTESDMENSEDQSIAQRSNSDTGSFSVQSDLSDGGSSAFSGSIQVPDAQTLEAPIDQPISTLLPRWIEDETGEMQLVLVREAILAGQPVTQGVWLDWERLRSDLLESVNDVLPGSSLVPVSDTQSSMSSVYQLATIPVAFNPARIDSTTNWRWSPATVGLTVTWISIIVTIFAVGFVLRAAIVLSQRRGRFVTAVTHELRTPLTTFRLYSQMLADGMVSDEQVKNDYLTILKKESERLTGIVENVLEYARLTRQRSSKDKSGVQTLSPGALIARFRPALARRAGQSNLDLVVSMDLEAHQDRTLTVDPHAVERIMMNLIENACKYAAPSELESDADSIEDADTRIHLDAGIRRGNFELLVADHGPGIAPAEASQIFGEFQRGWRGLSNARSGLGLGLALSRGLAREMEGDLVLIQRRGHGAEFLLTIPLDDVVKND